MDTPVRIQSPPTAVTFRQGDKFATRQEQITIASAILVVASLITFGWRV